MTDATLQPMISPPRHAVPERHVDSSPRNHLELFNAQVCLCLVRSKQAFRSASVTWSGFSPGRAHGDWQGEVLRLTEPRSFRRLGRHFGSRLSPLTKRGKHG